MSKKQPKAPPKRNELVRELIRREGAGGGKHHNREYDVKKGTRRKPKHKKRLEPM